MIAGAGSGSSVPVPRLTQHNLGAVLLAHAEVIGDIKKGAHISSEFGQVPLTNVMNVFRRTAAARLLQLLGESHRYFRTLPLNFAPVDLRLRE